MSDPRILMLDIETKPATAYTFGIRDQHLTHKQIVPGQHGGIICVGCQWLGEKRVTVYSDWRDGHQVMLEKVHALLSEADAVMTYNGASFDIPKLDGEFLRARMQPPPPPTQIDLFKTLRRMGYLSSKLDYILPHLGLGGKVKHEGLQMWIDVMDGCPKAQAKMARYCAQDVRQLGALYEVVRPWIRNHPHLHGKRGDFCGACGSNHITYRGFIISKHFRTQRVQCQDCGSWDRGKREAA